MITVNNEFIMDQNLKNPVLLHELDLDNKNYAINQKVFFDSLTMFPTDNIIKSLEFAYAMTFDNKGQHRPYRSGGTLIRTPMEIFKDTFHGKLAEFAFFNSYKSKYPDLKISEPNLGTWKLGKWDFTDFTITTDDRTFNFAIKSAKSYANLLLLETKDWDKDGTYIPNSIKYDGIFFVRISSYLNYDNLIIHKYKKYKLNQHFMTILKSGICPFINYDIPGFITNKDLINIINKGQIIKKGYTLNFDTIIDADNYYIQAGDLREWQQTDKTYNG